MHSHGQRSSEIDMYKVHEFFQSLFSVFVRGSPDGGRLGKLRTYDSKQVVENTLATPCPCFFLNYLVSSAPAGLGWGLSGKAWD